MGCAPTAGGGGRGQWPGGIWMSSSGPFVSRKLQMFAHVYMNFFDNKDLGNHLQ